MYERSSRGIGPESDLFLAIGPSQDLLVKSSCLVLRVCSGDAKMTAGTHSLKEMRIMKSSELIQLAKTVMAKSY